MKMIKNILLIITILLVVCTIIPITSNGGFKEDLSSITTGVGENNDAADAAGDIVGAILTILRIAAVGIAIIMLIILGMKYMMAAPGDKADIKKHAVVYVVGAVILFAASGILGIIQNFASQNVKV